MKSYYIWLGFKMSGAFYATTEQRLLLRHLDQSSDDGLLPGYAVTDILSPHAVRGVLTVCQIDHTHTIKMLMAHYQVRYPWVTALWHGPALLPEAALKQKFEAAMHKYQHDSNKAKDEDSG